MRRLLHPALLAAAPVEQAILLDVESLVFISGNTSLPISKRLAALRKGFFAPGHDAHVWLQYWYPDSLAMEHVAILVAGDLTKFWADGDETQILEIVPA